MCTTTTIASRRMLENKYTAAAASWVNINYYAVYMLVVLKEETHHIFYPETPKHRG